MTSWPPPSMTSGCPPCPTPDDCVCDEAAQLADELAFPAGEEIECADSDCALRQGHTVPHMTDLALARYDGAGQVTQAVLPL